MEISELEKKCDEISSIDEQMFALSERRSTLRLEIIDGTKSLGIKSFTGERFKVTVGTQRRMGKLDLDAIRRDFDLSDCYELTLARVKSRPDIPIENYAKYNTVDTLKVTLKE